MEAQLRRRRVTGGEAFKIEQLFPQYGDLLSQRFATELDSLKNLFAAVLNRFGGRFDLTEPFSPLFDFEDRFVDRLEVGSLCGALLSGPDAEGSSQRQRGAEKQVARCLFRAFFLIRLLFDFALSVSFSLAFPCPFSLFM